MKMTSAVFLLATMPTVMAQSVPLQPTQPKADVIFLHGNIYTGVADTSSFHANPRTEALAVRDGRVAAVGRDDEILRLKGSATTVIDLAGHFVMPGFNDAHMHLANAGFRRLTVELGGVKTLTEFRDRLAFRHRCLSLESGSTQPRYCFVHGDFALANSSGGHACGVDSEMQILAETGCYADFTLPTGPFHPAQIAKINSVYECDLPLDQAAPHRKGRDLSAGRPAQTFPLMVQGPLLLGRKRGLGSLRLILETGAFTRPNPPSLHRLSLWKQARIHVQGRPDWLFIKLQCHGMEPWDESVMLGSSIQDFLRELVEGPGNRTEYRIHFVTMREMVNIALAACDGREGNPGEYRDYRFQLVEVPVRRVLLSYDLVRSKSAKNPSPAKNHTTMAWVHDASFKQECK